MLKSLEDHLTEQKIINFCVINDEKYTGKFIDIEKKTRSFGIDD